MLSILEATILQYRDCILLQNWTNNSYKYLSKIMKLVEHETTLSAETFHGDPYMTKAPLTTHNLTNAQGRGGGACLELINLVCVQCRCCYHKKFPCKY